LKGLDLAFQGKKIKSKLAIIETNLKHHKSKKPEFSPKMPPHCSGQGTVKKRFCL